MVTRKLFALVTGSNVQGKVRYSSEKSIGRCQAHRSRGTGGYDPVTLSFEKTKEINVQIDQTFANIAANLKAAGGAGWDQVCIHDVAIAQPVMSLSLTMILLGLSGQLLPRPAQ